jgi:desulfoferrodoxin-like iron-binding protein
MSRYLFIFLKWLFAHQYDYISKSTNFYITNLVEVITMAVMEKGEKYLCNLCGNEVIVTKVGGGTLVCCGEDMELIK